MCGYKPDPDTVAHFLKNHVLRGTQVSIPSPPPTLPKAPTVAPTAPTPLTIGFSLAGQWHAAQNAREVLISVFRKFAERDSTFLDRFAALPRHGTKGRYLARSPEAIYPGRPDLAQDPYHTNNFLPGWWLLVHWSKKGIEKLIKMACEVARVSYGTDLIINLGNQYLYNHPSLHGST